EVEKTYSTTTFNGTFMQETIYRRLGSPEVDSAWEALGIDYRPSVIPEQEGHAGGLTKHHVQRAKKYEGGYSVQVEGLHHLHCLNLVRKSLYFNYNHYKTINDDDFDVEEDILKYHVTHCLDIIRQVLMCNADTGVLGQVWTQQSSRRHPHAFPDFNTRHTNTSLSARTLIECATVYQISCSCPYPCHLTRYSIRLPGRRESRISST
ncbi:uncharacterized protein B0T15DRAFT_400731, partial [Chaetomium strumarium]